MQIKHLKNSFIKYCTDLKFQQNIHQVKIIEKLINFYKFSSPSILNTLFLRKKIKYGFYLHGDVGVGKTMVLNFFYDYIEIPKKKYHFNEFMINFHNFRHNFKDIDKVNIINSFIKNLKKNCELIFFDEFQVTNIVDAMILGKLFEAIFKEKIKIIITSNTSIDDLYTGGLQRDQFIPFIYIFKKNSIEESLVINKDYRKQNVNTLKRFFSPINEETTFKINQLFRKLTKEKKHSIQHALFKGRGIKIENYYEKIARFKFDDLCKKNLSAEDYLEITSICNFIVIEKIPNFDEQNINEQQRFITLIDIIYDKKIPLMISSFNDLQTISSSNKLMKPFKRTLSRIYELTSREYL